MKFLSLLLLFSSYLFSSTAFITSVELRAKIIQKNLVLIDTTDNDTFNNGHIPSALRVDASAFRHKEKTYALINSPKNIQKKARFLGINSNSEVVIYGHGNNNKEILKSSYIALALIANGFTNVSILNGGYAEWVDEYEGFISKVIRTPKQGNFVAKFNKNILVDLTYVKNRIGKVSMIEARPLRYFNAKDKSKGVKRLGHIKDATSSFWGDKFNTDDTLKSDKELQNIYISHDKLSADKEVIAYCTGGLEASMNWYILSQHLKFKNVKIYDASMREWGNIDDTPMEK